MSQSTSPSTMLFAFGVKYLMTSQSGPLNLGSAHGRINRQYLQYLARNLDVRWDIFLLYSVVNIPMDIGLLYFTECASVASMQQGANIHKKMRDILSGSLRGKSWSPIG